jgi:hypothetical protein
MSDVFLITFEHSVREDALITWTISAESLKQAREKAQRPVDYNPALGWVVKSVERLANQAQTSTACAARDCGSRLENPPPAD